MNIKQLRILIRDSKDKKWYKSVSLNIEYTAADFEIKLDGFIAIFLFFKEQKEFYDSLKPLPEGLDGSKNYFTSAFGLIESLIQNYLVKENPGQEAQWNRYRPEFEKNDYNNESIFNKESAITDAIITLNEDYPGASRGVVDFLSDRPLQQNIRNKSYHIGWTKAYEFYTQNSELTKRSKSERRTLGRIRSKFLKNLQESDKIVNEHVLEKEKEYEEMENKLGRLIRLKNNRYEGWLEESKGSFDTFLIDSNQKIAQLEKLYQEKLKLEAPAQYWKKRASVLKKEGRNWMWWLIGSSIIATVALIIILSFISDGTLKDLFDNTGSAIRWSVIFITFVSFLAFAIRNFSKLMFSTFHLSRDAEEREQLAYVYLALKKEQEVDPAERHLIMQSLFSRADSGLLKDDSTPSMPGGGVVDKLFGGGK